MAGGREEPKELCGQNRPRLEESGPVECQSKGWPPAATRWNCLPAENRHLPWGRHVGWWKVGRC